MLPALHGVRVPPGLLTRDAIRPAAIVAAGVLSLVLAAADLASRIRGHRGLY